MDAFMISVDGKGEVNAFLLFEDEEGAVTRNGFDTTILFGDDEGSSTESGLQEEGSTLINGVSSDVDAQNMERANKLLVTDSTRDILDFSETDKPEITNTAMPLKNRPNVSDELSNRKKKSMTTNVGMNGLGDDEPLGEIN